MFALKDQDEAGIRKKIVWFDGNISFSAETEMDSTLTWI